MLPDQELLAAATGADKKARSNLRMSLNGGTLTIFHLGCFYLPDGRVIRFDEMGDAYFAEE